MARLARAWSAIAAVWSAAAGLLFVFGPVHGGCRVGVSGSVRVLPDGTVVTTSDPQIEVCSSTGLLEIQPDIWPMPMIAIVVWSLAPALAAGGIWRGRSMWPVYGALGLEATVLLSMGAGPFFVPLVLVPLALTTYLASRARGGIPDTTKDLPPTGREV